MIEDVLVREACQSASLMSGPHDELGVEREGEVVVADSHLEVLDSDEVSQGVGNRDFRHTVRVQIVDPGNDHLESVVEEVSDMLVGVGTLKVLDSVGLDLSVVHRDLVPLCVDEHTFQPHIEVNVHVVEENREVLLFEVLVPDFDLHAELDLHFLSVENEAWSPVVLDSCAEGRVIASVRSEVGHEALES